MSSFVLTLNPAKNEMPTSFLSRLAARNGCPDLRSLCRDIGLDLRSVANGDTQAIQYLCHLMGLPTDTFCMTMVKSVSKGHYLLRQEFLDRYTLNRCEVRVCPKCLRQQHQQQSSMWSKVHQFHWQIPQIERCVVHSERLLTITPKQSSVQRFDTSKAIQNTWDKIETASEREAPDAFDLYLSRRVYRDREAVFCDQLSIPALWRVSEALGITLTYERATRRSQLDKAELRQAVLKEFELILSERLKAVGRIGEPLELNNLVVSCEELAKALPEAVRNGFTKTELSKRWSMSLLSLNKMIENGDLRQVRMKHSLSRMTGMLIPTEDVEAYECRLKVSKSF